MNHHCVHYSYPKDDYDTFFKQTDSKVLHKLFESVQSESKECTVSEVFTFVQENVKCHHCLLNIMSVKSRPIQYHFNTIVESLPEEISQHYSCQQLFGDYLRNLKEIQKNNPFKYDSYENKSIYDIIKGIIEFHHSVYEHVRNTIFVDTTNPIFHVFTNLQICLRGLLVNLQKLVEESNTKIQQELQNTFPGMYEDVDSCPMITGVHFKDTWEYWKNEWGREHPELIPRLEAILCKLDEKRRKQLLIHVETMHSLVRKSKFLQSSVVFFSEDYNTVLHRFNVKNILQLSFELVVGPLGNVQSIMKNPEILPLIKIGVDRSNMFSRTKNGFHEHMTAWIHLRSYFVKYHEKSLRSTFPFIREIYEEIDSIVGTFRDEWSKCEDECLEITQKNKTFAFEHLNVYTRAYWGILRFSFLLSFLKNTKNVWTRSTCGSREDAYNYVQNCAKRLVFQKMMSQCQEVNRQNILQELLEDSGNHNNVQNNASKKKKKKSKTSNKISTRIEVITIEQEQEQEEKMDSEILQWIDKVPSRENSYNSLHDSSSNTSWEVVENKKKVQQKPKKKIQQKRTTPQVIPVQNVTPQVVPVQNVTPQVIPVQNVTPQVVPVQNVTPQVIPVQNVTPQVIPVQNVTPQVIPVQNVTPQVIPMQNITPQVIPVQELQQQLPPQVPVQVNVWKQKEVRVPSGRLYSEDLHRHKIPEYFIPNYNSLQFFMDSRASIPIEVTEGLVRTNQNTFPLCLPSSSVNILVHGTFVPHSFSYIPYMTRPQFY